MVRVQDRVVTDDLSQSPHHLLVLEAKLQVAFRWCRQKCLSQFLSCISCQAWSVSGCGRGLRGAAHLVRVKVQRAVKALWSVTNIHLILQTAASSLCIFYDFV